MRQHPLRHHAPGKPNLLVAKDVHAMLIEEHCVSRPAGESKPVSTVPGRSGLG